MTTKTLEVLRVPFDWGAGRRGAALGPEAIVQAGLPRKLQELGFAYEIRPEVVSAKERQEAHPAMKHLAKVLAINESLARAVSVAVEAERFPLVLGGDHSIAIGTVAGLTQRYRSLGVLWFDAHSDMNTEQTTPSGNIHGMSLAASLGLGSPLLTSLGGGAPKIKPGNVAIIGARSLDQEEKVFIRSLGVTCYTMQDIDRKGIGKVVEEAIRAVSAGTDGVHVSFDVDSLDPLEAPGTGTPVGAGLHSREAFLALEMLHEAGIVVSAEFVEVNPTRDDGRTARLAVELIGSLLGETIL